MWEGDTRNFLNAKPKTFVDHISANLFWQDGLVSTPQRSLIFGIPLYFVNSLLEARILSLTLVVSMSYLALLLAPNAVSRLAILLFLCHPITVFYSLYGVSVGAAIALAMLIVVVGLRLLQSTRNTVCLFFGALVALASYEYTPARFFSLLILLIVIFFQLRASRIKASLLTVTFPLMVFFWNLAHGRVEYFYASRGEQVINFLQQSDYIKMFFGKESLSSPTEMILFLIEKNFPDLVKQFRFSFQVVTHDPPLIPLTFGFFGPLAVLGLIVLFLGGKSQLILLLTPSIFIPALLLLTTRVDTHRISVLVAVVSILAGQGLMFLLSRIKPRSLRFILLVLIILCTYAVSVWALARA